MGYKIRRFIFLTCFGLQLNIDVVKRMLIFSINRLFTISANVYLSICLLCWLFNVQHQRIMSQSKYFIRMLWESCNRVFLKLLEKRSLKICVCAWTNILSRPTQFRLILDSTHSFGVANYFIIHHWGRIDTA